MKRAFVLGLLLSAGICILEPFLLMRIQTNGVASDFMTAGALLGLLVLIFLSSLLSFLHRRFILNPPELLLIFIMGSVACVLPSWGLMGNLFPVIAGLSYFASPQNQWMATFITKIKPWLINQDLRSVTYFYEGMPAGMQINYLPWLKPLSAWFVLVLLFYFLSICLAVIFRKQWVEHERLVFPLAVVPLEMTRKNNPAERIPSLFKNKIMWLGFAIPFIIISLNGLNYYIPGFRINLLQFVPIFRNTDTLVFYFSFPILGFAYLLNLNVAFSLWFFHLASKIQTGWFNITGYSLPGSNEVFAGSSAATSFQGGGAMVVLFFFLVWLARKHLSSVFRKAFGKDGSIDDSQEIISYKTAVFGGLASLISLGAGLRYIGMPFLVVIFFLFFVLVVFLGLTRIISQAGIGFARSQCVPPDFTAYTLPPGVITPSGYIGLGLQYAWAADIRTTVLASTANALKIQEETKIKPRMLFWAIIVTIIIGYFVSAWTIIRLGCRYGSLNSANGWFFTSRMPSAVAEFIANKINNPLTSSVILPRLLFTGLGAIIMGFLVIMNHRFLWWPLHYIGFPIADTHVMRYAWFPILVAWLIKSLILRYGGPAAYRKSVPFFLGLILGLIAAVGIWTIINIASKDVINPIWIGVP